MVEEFDENNEVSKLQQEYRRTRTAKTASRSATFQVKKQALYAEARETSKDIVRVGTAHL
ncbi:hypothetical protein K443DRAFT_672661 [Laccaria amethystina LaAM-08-1]|uniref:Uncharacterized protein n=1 Tax=Laccaria amethystina LaAM-08-1 TaxID=1095629 RepID=A0A0C9YJ93_9AGAR|nr:hypothetical protein K443DRAFT_672661 [Laccaria amethystina LaAM-08-1]